MVSVFKFGENIFGILINLHSFIMSVASMPVNKAHFLKQVFQVGGGKLYHSPVLS